METDFAGAIRNHAKVPLAVQRVLLYSNMYFDMKFLIIMGVLSILWGCRSPHEILVIRETKPLITEDSVRLGNNCTMDMTLIDSSIILFNHCSNHFFSIFDPSSLKPVCSFGTKGKGPNEFQYPMQDRSLQSINDNTSLLIYDGNLLAKKELEIPALLRDTVVYNFHSENLPKILFANKDVNRLNDTLYAGIPMSKYEGPFAILDIKNDKTVWSESDWGFTMPQRSEMLSYLITYGSLCANTKKQIIVRSYRNIDMIQLFGFDGRLVKNICLSKPECPPFDPQKNCLEPEHNQYHLEMFATPERIYTLHYAHPYNDIKNGTATPTILAFDWDGNLTAAYDCPRPIQQFCVDETNRKIYGISGTSEIEYNRLFRFSY